MMIAAFYAFDAAHPGTKHLWDHDASIGLLVIFQNGDQRSRQR